MSCFQPWTINVRGRSYPVPCGYCLNCRVDRRNLWQDRCNYELMRFKVGSFVTLTYDDIHIVPNLVLQSDGGFAATLNYSDVRKFIQRLRKYIKYHNKIWSPFIFPNFTYLFVGEYGENGTVFDRPHYHLLFFGLDFQYSKDLIEKEWSKGLVDVKPILDGGIKYVLKYMDKQVKGFDAFMKYDMNFLERPKQFQSLGFGRGLYFKDYEDVRNNNFTYPVNNLGVRRPIPSYFKNKFRDYRNFCFTDDSRIIDKMRSYNLKDFSTHRKFEFLREKSRLREREIYLQSLNSGIPVFDYVRPFYNSLKIVNNIELAKRVLADEKVHNLEVCYER